MAGFSLSKALPLSLVLLFLSGAFTVACFSLVSSLVQETTSDAMRGRVMSVYNVAFRGGMPIGSLITGALIPRMTAPLALAVNGVLLSILGILYLTKQRGVVRLGFQPAAARIVEER